MHSAANETPAFASHPLRAEARDQLRYAVTVEILDLWLNGAAEQAADGVPGFDPLDAPHLLGFIYILEQDGERMRYRVSGESVNMLFGSNHGGKCLDEVVPTEIYPLVAPYFRDVFNLKACIFKGHVVLSTQRLAEFERLLLPVRRGGKIQVLGTLALSTSAPLRTDASVPPRADQGFNFTQIDLITGDCARSGIPLANLPVEQLPFESHVKRRAWLSNTTREAAQKDFETEY